MTEVNERFVVDDVADDARAAMESLKAEPDTVAEVIAEPAPVEVVETASEKTERLRDETGKFAKKPDEPQVEAKPDVQAVDPTAKPVLEQKPDAAQPVIDGPPPGYSVKTKADWEKLKAAFPHVAADIAKRNAEYNSGLAGLKDYQDLKPFAERAKAAGQTLSQTLSAYTGIDDLFRRDAASGFTHVAQNLGMSQSDAAQLFLRLATQLGATPQAHQPAPADTGQAPQNGFDPNAIQRIIAEAMQPVGQKLQTLEQHFAQQSQRDQTLRQTDAQRVVDQFRTDPKHRYYDDVEGTVFTLLQNGIVPRSGDAAADLAKAYEQACYLHPEVREALINERTVATEAARTASRTAATEKAKLASRSVTGSPSSGAVQRKPAQRAEGKSYEDDLNEDVTAAVRLVAARA